MVSGGYTIDHAHNTHIFSFSCTSQVFFILRPLCHEPLSGFQPYVLLGGFGSLVNLGETAVTTVRPMVFPPFSVVLPICRKIDTWLWASRTEMRKFSFLWFFFLVAKPKLHPFFHILPLPFDST